jgi:hypothetical protein
MGWLLPSRFDVALAAHPLKNIRRIARSPISRFMGPPRLRPPEGGSTSRPGHGNRIPELCKPRGQGGRVLGGPHFRGNCPASKCAPSLSIRGILRSGSTSTSGIPSGPAPVIPASDGGRTRPQPPTAHRYPARADPCVCALRVPSGGVTPPPISVLTRRFRLSSPYFHILYNTAP